MHSGSTRAAVNAKITGAALAAAFASKNERKEGKLVAELSLDEKEAAVVAAIREGLEAGPMRPRRAFDALAEFGKASGSLAQSWLTPQSLEVCVSFWGGGGAILARDLRRGRLSFRDLKASSPFALLALNTFPWTPLLVPLVARAVNNGSLATSTFVPTFFSPSRLAALRRLRRDTGLEYVASADFRTPQDIDGGVAFFSDGTRMLLRDARRGRLLAYGDKPSVYGWFALLTLSTFPLTPLLLPIIDKRRTGDGEAQSDYVPAAFRARRLHAYARLKAVELTPTATPPLETIRTAAAAERVSRASPAELLAAVIGLEHGAAADTSRLEERAHFLDRLGGSPTRQWRLVYTAGKGAVIRARQQHKDPARGGPAWIGNIEALLPWTRLRHGLYVDSVVRAVQHFDAATWENENGIFGVLGVETVQFSVRGPFKWPNHEKRAVCAFQPTSAHCKLGPFEWEWLLDADAEFEAAPVTKLPFFRFIHVDEVVAVAQGRSGGVAVWVREDRKLSCAAEPLTDIR